MAPGVDHSGAWDYYGTSDTHGVDDGDYDGHRPCGIEPTFSRIQTARRRGSSTSTSIASRRETVLSRIRSRNEVPPFTHPLANVQTTQEVLVCFEGPDDPYHPLNWPMRKKVTTTLIYGFVTMTATWASSSFSAGTAQVAQEFHIGEQTAVLGTTLFLIGFGLGPLLWAPMSEVYGRRMAVLPQMFVASCFSFASATSTNFQTLILTRFFGALFASAPVTNTGGVMGDLFSPAHRGIAMAGGTTLGPIVSAAFVANPSLGWRWTEYFTGILQAFMLVVAAVLIDESYPPSLLIVKAKRLRHETGNWALHARFEEWDVGFAELARKFLLRPAQLLGTPICFLIAFYASFVFGILYLNLGSIPIIFGELRGWSSVVATLPFLGLLLGAFAGAGINVWNQFVYNAYFHEAGDRAVPERRLPPMMAGGCLFAAGLFITGWTADPRDAPWIAPVIGLFMTGCGFFMIFQAALNYLVDTFQLYAASAVAANTFLRSCFAAAFPLAVTPLYHNLGVGPGSSIFGGIGCLLIPVPFVFFIYGKRIRASSKWSKASVY
ncbi:MSF membrane transporter [Plectosphaerella plurivora]|uniref:MSF membrane transporter n=1 Tax=Plectosphaerella plurivora TaxID=936078 RepID=A0A9P9A587_9PEZI|nr:MSF membrane transporter [Plectosphaerella plurivora]